MLRKIFRIGTVRYAEGLWRMHRHGPVIAHCTDSEDFPMLLYAASLPRTEILPHFRLPDFVPCILHVPFD